MNKRTTAAELDLQQRAIASQGSLTPADVEANDVEFRCDLAEPDPFPGYVACGLCEGGVIETYPEGFPTLVPCPACDGTGRVVFDNAPRQWTRPRGYEGACPGCGSTTCPGYYKPDGNHLLAF